MISGERAGQRKALLFLCRFYGKKMGVCYNEIIERILFVLCILNMIKKRKEIFYVFTTVFMGAIKATLY